MTNVQRIHYDICDSTNLRAREYLKEHSAQRLLITATEQSAGRGRQGKSFYSPCDSGVYMTFAFAANMPLCDAAFITTAAAAGVADALERLTGKRLCLKWVNDIYYNNKKICGILCESVVRHETNMIQYIIIGVGINLTTDSFPEELKDIAGNLGEFDKKSVVDAVCTALCKIADNPRDRSFMDYYRSRSMVIGKRITCTIGGEQKDATALAIDEFGGLCVRFDDQSEQTLTSGEISIKVQN